MRVTSRNARFQQWEALLGHRAKRQRQGAFIVQGVRPVTLAVRHGWPVRELLYKADAVLSRWARETLAAGGAAQRVAVSAELMHELGGKDDDVPELLAVVALPGDELTRIPAGPALLTVVFDRPASPGNVGTLIRSADAFGASGVIITGHAADVYDPRSVRASTGSLFALPVVRAPSHRPVLDWVATIRAAGTPVTIVGADEGGRRDAADVDLTGPAVLLIGNEAAGLSAGWREACDELARIPMLGTASSLNAAAAASVLLYESARQRLAARRASSS
jgi:TrmH family RNA methyltransferase